MDGAEGYKPGGRTSNEEAAAAIHAREEVGLKKPESVEMDKKEVL